jgi:MFS family permease
VKLPLVLPPLRNRDFRLLWTGQSVSIFGNFLHQVAVPFQLLALGASPIQLGIGASISTAVQLVLFLFAGAIVDRVPRRRVILM